MVNYNEAVTEAKVHRCAELYKGVIEAYCDEFFRVVIKAQRPIKFVKIND